MSPLKEPSYMLTPEQIENLIEKGKDPFKISVLKRYHLMALKSLINERKIKN